MANNIDKELQKYVPVIDFFSNILGDTSEIVLHDIKSQELYASIVYIRNGLTGRGVGSPATDFLLNILKSESYRENDYKMSYRSRSFNGHEFISSSFFIKDDQNEIIGMICVNTDQTRVNQVGKKMEDALECFANYTSYIPKCKASETEIDETLIGSVGNMIDQAIFSVTGDRSFEPKHVSRKQKLLIVKYLNEREYFAYKNAVLDLAQVFQMSEVSIYKYLQTVKTEELELIHDF